MQVDHNFCGTVAVGSKRWFDPYHSWRGRGKNMALDCFAKIDLVSVFYSGQDIGDDWEFKITFNPPAVRRDSTAPAQAQHDEDL